MRVTTSQRIILMGNIAHGGKISTRKEMSNWKIVGKCWKMRSVDKN
jgi:hypothetical protein